MRRALYAVLTFFIALLMIFIIPRLIAVSPVEIIAASQQLPPSVIKLLTAQFGLDKPLYIQFLLYIKNVVFTFPPNLGFSYEYYPQSVWSMLVISLPWTLFLVGSSVAVSAFVGTMAGLYAGMNRGKALDKLLTYTSMATQSMPYFWIAIMFQIILAVVLRLFPIGGAISITDTSPVMSLEYIQDVLYHAMLPMITIVVATTPVYAIIMRNTLADIIREDYMVAGEAKGLRKSRLYYKYGLRNGILPIVSLIAVHFGYVVGGALLVEIVFSYPGVGTLLFNAILSHDYPMIQGVFYILGITVIGANFIADLIYSYIDPRIRYS